MYKNAGGGDSDLGNYDGVLPEHVFQANDTLAQGFAAGQVMLFLRAGAYLACDFVPSQLGIKQPLLIRRYMVEADAHCMNLFCALVGETSKGRKGTSWGHVARTLGTVDPEWADNRITAGLVSGEGLIWNVRDVTDGSDKRLLLIEQELASVLKVIVRRENTLSAVVRQAWDSGCLRTLSKKNPAAASDAHISIIGHITRDELRKELTATEIANGFANRFLWFCVRRYRLLPEGGQLDLDALSRLSKEITKAVEFAKSVGELKRDGATRQLWAEQYPSLSEGKLGMFGAVTSRAEAQVTRLACIYALLDCSSTVREIHMRAALEVWRYAEDSARYIFGDAVGDPLADKIWNELIQVPKGLNRTEISSLLGRHTKSEEIGRSLSILYQQQRAFPKIENTGGRNVERWLAKCEISERSAKSPFA